MIGRFLFGFGQIGWMEGLIILVIVLILFGGRKIPQLARDLGSGIREFRKSLSGAVDEASEAARLDDQSDEPVRKTGSKSKKKTRG
jgi:sec-independent protein translocase protein TatA